MDVTKIPFAKHVGIKENNETLCLDEGTNLLNHLNTVHASAQFTLAETQSGLYLQILFPELIGKVIPLLRSSLVKYKTPAKGRLKAFASVESEIKEKFEKQFQYKNRGSISVNVEVRDNDNVITMSGEFVWFIQG